MPSRDSEEPGIVRFELDENLPLGKVALGGVWICTSRDDHSIGRAVRTKLVRCRDVATAHRLAAELPGHEIGFGFDIPEASGGAQA
jgi:hypothetical protein